VRTLLDDALPESRAHALWQRIQAVRGGRGVPLRRAWGLALVSAVLAAGLVLWLTRTSAPGVLTLADGHEVPGAIDVAASAVVALSDGSRIDVGAEAHLDVLESTGRAFGLALRRGQTVFDVHPGGPRTWRIECGGVTVEVVGTRFTVARSPSSVRVAVERGAVLVRGETVPDRVVRVSGGESIVIPLSGPAVGGATPSAGPGHVPSEGSAAGAGDSLHEPAKGQPSEGEAARANAQEERASPVERSGGGPGEPAGSSIAAFTLPEAPSAEALFAEADAARKAGRFADAARLLERVLVERPGGDRAALAEFSLGRLYLDSLGDARAASHHFRNALSHRLPATLAEDAQARLVEAFVRSGDSRAAGDAAARYRALYPGGRRLSDVDGWISGAH
jgi:transmembrane sensor